MNSILATIEANRAGMEAAVMLDHQGFVAEANSANLFVVQAGEIWTPLATACLPGITRELVIRGRLLKGTPIVERNISLLELCTADEIFLPGTAIGIVPVIEIDVRRIGSGSPGTMTLRISEWYRNLVDTQGAVLPDAIPMPAGCETTGAHERT